MCIYKISNSVNDKVYIGLTKNSVDDRWQCHLRRARQSNLKSKLYSAIRKYGKDKFTIEEIDKADCLLSLSDKEIEWIKRYDSVRKGYNILTGGININSDSIQDYWSSLSEEEKSIYGKNMAFCKQGVSTKSVGRKSKYFGVTPHGKNWRCQINFNKRKISRVFSSEVEAAKAYDKLALYHYGDHAKTNFTDRFSQDELEIFLANFRKLYDSHARKAIKKP